MRSPHTGYEWHDYAADLITLISERSPAIGRMIADLDIIPLSDRTWGKGSSRPLYIPARSGPAIPLDLVVRSIPTPSKIVAEIQCSDTSELLNARLKQFWTHCEQNIYGRGWSDRLAVLKAHISYLYWHSQRAGSDDLDCHDLDLRLFYDESHAEAVAKGRLPMDRRRICSL